MIRAKKILIMLLMAIACASASACKPDATGAQSAKQTKSDSKDGSADEGGDDPGSTSDDDLGAVPPEVLNGSFLTLATESPTEAKKVGLVDPDEELESDSRVVVCLIYENGQTPKTSEAVRTTGLKVKWAVYPLGSEGKTLTLKKNIAKSDAPISAAFEISSELAESGFKMDITVTGRDPDTDKIRSFVISGQLDPGA